MGQYGRGPNLQLVLWFVFTLSVKRMAVVYLFVCLNLVHQLCVFVLCLSFCAVVCRTYISVSITAVE